jgi:hypothetical protein
LIPKQCQKEIRSLSGKAIRRQEIEYKLVEQETKRAEV